VDLSPSQQKAVFALIVVVLAALGYWLILPKVTHSHAQAQATPTAAPSATAPASAPSTAAPTVTAAPAATGSVNIYSWLPFTQQDLADAAALTVKFCVDYDTYTYTESAAAYVATMNGLVTGQLATTLQASYSTPGVASLRKSQQQVSTGTAAISSLRAFGSSSLTFVVNTTHGTTQYAVTVTGSGSSWQVDDIELSSAGNA
jgi:hypothetical protein